MNEKLKKILPKLGCNAQQLKLYHFCIKEYIPLTNIKVESLGKDLDILEEAKLIKFDKELGNFILFNVPTQDEFLVFVEKYRNVFSVNEKGTKGLKPGSMGDSTAIYRKLKKWFKANKKYTLEDVLNTARFYVDDLIRGNKLKYLQAADYFIMKNDTSRLSSLIDEGKSYKRNGSLDTNTYNELI